MKFPSNDREILPQSTKPTHYDLRFEPDIEGGATEYDSEVIINLDVLEDTSLISLNATELTIIETQLATEGGQLVEISGLKFEPEKEWMSIALKTASKASSKAKLKQTFKGSLFHHAQGFFRSPHKGIDGKDTWIFSTQMENGC